MTEQLPATNSLPPCEYYGIQPLVVYSSNPDDDSKMVIGVRSMGAAVFHDLFALPSLSAGPDDVFDDLATNIPVRPRIQLYSRGRQVDRGLIAAGSFGVPRSDNLVLDLGPIIDVLVIARRAKAVDLNDAQEPVVVFDPTDPQFQRIQLASNEVESGCLYGIEFLVFEASTKKLYELFFGTRDSRPKARMLARFMPITLAEAESRGMGTITRKPMPVTLRSSLVSEEPYSCYVPEVIVPAKPVEGLPESDELVPEIMKFLNPPVGATR